MANHKSSKKRSVRNAKRAGMNKMRLSRLKTALKKIEADIASGDSAKAIAAVRAAQKNLLKEASQGVVSKRAAARKISRLSAKAKASAGKKKGA